MAKIENQLKGKTKYIDVDRTVVEPSPHRVRNILTLEERIQAIQAYDCRPMYTKVAKMFNCSWEQIKNIIANRDAIMEFYEATKNTERVTDPNQDEQRQRKITFLGECMYEYIQRLQFHTKADLSEELIRSKAFEFRDVIQIENFTPNKAWLNHFKATYDFSLSNRQITLTRTPPSSLDLKDIMTYCIRNQSKRVSQATHQPKIKNLYRTTTKIAVSSANDATLEELKQRRERKINFLERALCEYIQRAQNHHKVPLNGDHMHKVSCELKEMLKIDNFYPNKVWFEQFRKRFDFNLTQGCGVTTRTPLLSLDLRDILSYCSRIENKNQTAIQVTRPVPTLPPSEIVTAPPKPKSLNRRVPLLTVDVPFPNSNMSLLEMHELVEIKQELMELEQEEEEQAQKLQQVEAHELKQDHNGNNDINTEIRNSPLSRSTKSSECDFPAMKVPKIETDEAEIARIQSPGHWSEHSEPVSEPLPRQVLTYADALRLLKPLEEFAMLQENYRIIGLISQMEEIFKNSVEKIKDDPGDTD